MSEKTCRTIYCCKCGHDVEARLIDGREAYPHRSDLYSLPFWKCDTCRNFVGCHHKTENRTQPLGVIPSPAVKAERKKIHALLDPIWQSGRMPRARLYKRISDDLGYQYHTANIRSVDEARKVLGIVERVRIVVEEG